MLRKLTLYSNFLKKAWFFRKDASLGTISRKVDVVIYVNHALPIIKECLESAATDSPDYHLIIIDDLVNKETKDYLIAFSSRDNCTLIENLDALGYIKSVNNALSQSRAEYVVLLESNVIVTRGWLENMLECINNDETTGIAVPLFSHTLLQDFRNLPPDSQDLNGLLLRLNLEMLATLLENASTPCFPKVSQIKHSCLMIKRALIKEIGLLEEKGSSSTEEALKDYWSKAIHAGFYAKIADNCLVSQDTADLNSETTGSSMADDHAACAKRVSGSILQLIASSSLNKKLFDKSILFLVPSKGGSGGTYSVVQETAALRECGLNVKVGLLKPDINNFLFYHPEAGDFSFAYAKNNAPELIKSYEAFDIAVATNCASVKDLKAIVDDHPGVIPVYYIQDYEPWFFPADDPRHREAEESYTLVPGMVCFAKTDWLCKIIKRFHGIVVTKIKPSLNRSIYHPGRSEAEMISGPLKITAMVRPNTSRRAPQETLNILKMIKRKHRKGVDIRVFGCDDEELDTMEETKGFRFINLGELHRKQVAELLQGSDIFVDASQYQAFGCIGLEAMAAGCATVLPKNSGVSEYAQDQENCLLAETTDRKGIISAIEKLISDKKLLARIKKQGIKTAAAYSLRKAVWSEILLFNSVLTQEKINYKDSYARIE